MPKAPPPHLGILPSKRPGEPTPLTPYGDIWFTATGGGEPPWGQMARWLIPLQRVHGQPELAARFARYCASVPGQYLSVTRFANTVGAWATNTSGTARRSWDDPQPGESVDAYIARLARSRP